MSTPWTADRIPDLSGRRAVVTGATSGLGRVTALELARHGAHVVLAVRDAARGGAVADELRAELTGTPGAGDLEVGVLDLADLASVATFAESEGAGTLDLLVNNAGVMAIPRRETADGFEMQLGTNHLGHMALTLRLLPALVRAGSGEHGAARVVTVSSGAHRFGRIDLTDLMGERRYRPWAAYGQTKLANLLFAFELQRRLDARQLPVASFAAHPGYAATNLQSVGPQMRGSQLGARMAEIGNRLLAQPAEMGALPTLYAATTPGLPPAAFVGPDGFLEQRGHPRLVTATSAAYDEAVAAALWARSEELVGLTLEQALAGVGPDPA
ncbi:MAG: SDR family NAD(P)-dependent oxidoreductase [Frankiales bacterium]|nr:SDR family NAD(P)-dependent oxidoreductase [Frankiales bacterium]